jgi:hypothetical protein
MDFHFEVVRIWERPADELLNGGVGTLPLAALGALPIGLTPEVALPAVIRQMEERLARQAPPSGYAKLLTAAFVLAGLRLSADEVTELFQGVQVVEESTTYQWIKKQGALDEARKLLLRQGRGRFGEPDPAAAARVQAVNSLDELERLHERSLLVSTWQELFNPESD